MDMTVIAGPGVALADAVRVNRHWIGGQWVSGSETFERVSPSHGVVVSRSALGGVAETEAAIAAARGAFEGWSKRSGKARAAVLLKVADLIEQCRTDGAD